MKYDLTVLIAGIRVEGWKPLWSSIRQAFKKEFELIIVGPYDLPEELKGKSNIKHIKDWGSPMRCQQRGLAEAEGEWISIAADDGEYYRDSLHEGFRILKDNDMDYRTIVIGKYHEGPHPDQMNDPKYYYIYNHEGARCKWLPYSCMLMNMFIASRKLLWEIGGWDCQFEVIPMALCDMSIRVNKYGARTIIQEKPMLRCKYMPGHRGDHGPIHDAQTKHDMPLYHKIWGAEKCPDRIHIDMDNWKKSPERWERRFGKA